MDDDLTHLSRAELAAELRQLRAEREAAGHQADAEFMRGVLASSADCIKVLDLDGGLSFMSEGGMRVMEVSDFNLIRGCPWPDFWQGAGNDAAKAALAAAREGGVGHFQGAANTYLGTPKWWDVQVTPIRGPDGRPARILSVSRDITDQKLFEGRLAASEAHWRGLFERLSEGFIVGEVVRDAEGRAVDWRYIDANAASGKLLGIDPASVLGRTVREALPGIDDEWITDFAAVVTAGEATPFIRQISVLRRWYEGRAFPLEGDRFGVIFLEVTARVAADSRRNALLQLGDRLRDVTTTGEMTQAASEIVGRTLGATRAGFGRVVGDVEYIDIEPDWTAPGQGSVAGRHRYDDFGNIRAPLQRGEPLVVNDVASDPRTRDDAATWQGFDINAFVHMPVRAKGRTVAVFIVHDVQARVWTPEELAFLRNVADRVEVGVARVQAEELQGVLNNELAHRLKNTLAIVQSIASSTLRGVTERDMVEAFERRVLALSRAHDVLMQKSWTAAKLRAVMESVLSMQADLDRFALDGPDMDISPQAALSLSLLLHELATNALKYGALSAQAGKVQIAWRTEDGQAPTLVLDWTESGGPSVNAPAGRGGFGSKLIRMGLLGTRKAALDYTPVGLKAEFRAPLAEVQVRVH